MSLLPTIVIMLLIVGGMRHFHLLNNLDFYHVDDPQQLESYMMQAPLM